MYSSIFLICLFIRPSQLFSGKSKINQSSIFFNFLAALTIECLGADEDIFVFHHILLFGNISKIRSLGFVM